MKIKVPFMPAEVQMKAFGNVDVQRVEQMPFQCYSEQLLAQENRQTDMTKPTAVTTYERDLLLHVKAAHTYFKLYRPFDGLIAQSFCGKLIQYEVITKETVLKKMYHVQLVDVIFSMTSQQLEVLEGQFLRTYCYKDQWIYVIMESL